MQKYLLITFVCLLIIWSSCGGNGMDEISIATGEEYVDGNSEIYYTDSFTIETSSVLMDSVSTSNTGVALVGNFSNEYLGNVEAQAVFRLSNPSPTSPDVDDEITESEIIEVFDSVTFRMDYEGYYIGDTTQTFEFGLYELTSDIEEMYDNQTVDGVQYGFYNVTRVTTADDPIQTYTLDPPRPAKAEDFEVRLPDEWGLEIFRMMINDEFDDTDTRAFSTDKFYDYLHGIVIKSTSTASNEAILGFLATADSMGITIYYNGGENAADGDDPDEININLSESNYQFNSIITDRTGTVLEGMDDKSSDQTVNYYAGKTDDKTFIQGGTGVMTKVRFPTLGNIFDVVDNVNNVIRAQLLLYPVNHLDDINDLPSSLAIYSTNRLNTNLGSVSVDGDVAYLSLATDNENILNQYVYSIDITEPLVTELIDEAYDPEFSFLIAPTSSDMQGGITTLIFGGSDGDLNYQPVLKLYTFTY